MRATRVASGEPSLVNGLKSGKGNPLECKTNTFTVYSHITHALKILMMENRRRCYVLRQWIANGVVIRITLLLVTVAVQNGGQDGEKKDPEIKRRDKRTVMQALHTLHKLNVSSPSLMRQFYPVCDRSAAHFCLITASFLSRRLQHKRLQRTKMVATTKNDWKENRLSANLRKKSKTTNNNGYPFTSPDKTTIPSYWHPAGYKCRPCACEEKPNKLIPSRSDGLLGQHRSKDEGQEARMKNTETNDMKVGNGISQVVSGSSRSNGLTNKSIQRVGDNTGNRSCSDKYHLFVLSVHLMLQIR